jgi:membrane-associated phospholipid phosphatase
MSQWGGAALADLSTVLAGAPPAAGAGSGSGLYDSVIAFAVGTPSWFQGLFSLYTKVGLLIFVAFFGWALWRARAKSEPAGMALALLAPVGTLVAYVLSEVIKSIVHEERPCRTLVRTATVLKCPDVGDWSFPSNHSVIAASATVGLIFAWRKLAPWVITLALLMGFSRVFVGAHYPHDVLVGLLLGAAVSWLLFRFATKPATALVVKFGDHPILGRVLAADPPEEFGEPEDDRPFVDDDDETVLLPRVPAQPPQRPRGPAQQPAARTAHLPQQPPPRRPQPARRPDPRRQARPPYQGERADWPQAEWPGEPRGPRPGDRR